MHTLHANFNGGLMTPLMAGRFDTDKLKTGAAVMENMLPRVYGGVFKRPGTQFNTSSGTGFNTKGNGQVRLIPFRRNTEINYVLELGDNYMRFWRGSNETPSGYVPLNSVTSGFVSWASSTQYSIGALRSNGGLQYYCLVNHTSGASFSADLALGYWYQLTGTYSISTIIEIPTPWDVADLFDIKFVQLNDVMIFTHPSYHPQRLTRLPPFTTTPGDIDRWKIDAVPFDFAPSLDVNSSRAAVQLQYYNVTDWQNKATPYNVGDRVLGITAPYVGVIYTCHTSHTPTAVANDEPGVGSAFTSYWNEGTSSTTIAAWANATAYVPGNRVQRNKVYYLCKRAHTSSTPTYVSGTPKGGNRPQDGQYWTYYWTIDSAGNDLRDLDFKLVSSEKNVFQSGDVGTVWQLEIATSGRKASFSVASGSSLGPSDPIFIQGAYRVSTTWNSGAAMIGSLYLEESTDNVVWSRVREWIIDNANEGNIGYDGEAPSVGAWYRISADRTSGGTGGVFKMEPADSVLTVPVRLDSYIATDEMGCTVLLPGETLPDITIVGVSTTAYRKPAFSTTEGYPAAVCFHDSRLWFAGTPGQGSRIWASQIDDFYNFLTGNQDTDGLDLTLASIEANDILWLASHNRALVVGTKGQEWTVDGGDSETVIKPSSVRARLRTRYGSEGIAPQVIAEALLWVPRSGNQLREFTYSFQEDGFTAPDLTKLIGQIPGKIIQMAYQAVPDPIIWLVTDRGELWGFSYSREDNVTAWHKHTTGLAGQDKFTSVACIYGGDASVSDQIFVVVQRTVNGVPGYNIERFSPKTMDWVLTGNGELLNFAGGNVNLTWLDRTATELGLSQFSQSGNDMVLNFATAYLRGNIIKAFSPEKMFWTESSNAVAATTTTFPNTTKPSGSGSEKVIIGMPYIATVQAFPLEVMLRDGTGQGREWRVNRVVALLHDSLGGAVFDKLSTFFDLTTISETTLRYPDNVFTQEAPPFTTFRGRIEEHILADWGGTTQIAFVSDEPVPFGLLGYVMISEVSGT